MNIARSTLTVTASAVFFSLVGPLLGTLSVLVIPGRQPIEIPAALMAGYLIGIVPAAIAGLINGICLVTARNSHRALTLRANTLFGAFIGFLSTVLVFVAASVLEERSTQLAGAFIVAAPGAIAGGACAAMINGGLGDWFERRYQRKPNKSLVRTRDA